MKVVLACTILAVLAGCTTLSPQECGTTDWRGLGYRDGFEGSVVLVDRYAAQCAPHGAKPDADAYATGFEGGRRERARRRF